MLCRRPPRLYDGCYLGARSVFFTMCTFERRSYFLDFRVGARLCEQLLSTATRYDVEVVAYCFMPDHLHLLVEGRREGADIRKWTGAFRRVSGFHFRQEFGPRLWQDGCYDRVLRKEEAMLSVAKYIVLNPVRAGLCADAGAYPLLGSSRFERSELLTASDWYPPSRG